jgi:hypothetical protein
VYRWREVLARDKPPDGPISAVEFAGDLGQRKQILINAGLCVSPCQLTSQRQDPVTVTCRGCGTNLGEEFTLRIRPNSGVLAKAEMSISPLFFGGGSGRG